MAATLTIAQHVILKAVTYAFTPLNASQVRAAAGLPSATSALETTQAALADLLALGLVERQVTGGRSTYRATWDAQAALDAHEAAKAAQHAAAVTVHPERNAPAVPAPFHYVATGPIDHSVQLHAYQSFVEAWKDTPREKFMGAFVWEWEPGLKIVNGNFGHGSYSVQGTPSMDVLKKWFAMP